MLLERDVVAAERNSGYVLLIKLKQEHALVEIHTTGRIIMTYPFCSHWNLRAHLAPMYRPMCTPNQQHLCSPVHCTLLRTYPTL